MAKPHRNFSRRVALIAGVSVLAVGSPLVAPAVSNGRPVTILACDAAGGASSSWVPLAGSVNSYKICPTNRNDNFGMVTRAVGRTFRAGEYSRLGFYPPAGTTIVGLSWAGRWNRACGWATEIRAMGGQTPRSIVGSGPGCTTGAGQSPTWFAAPAGTTSLLQNTQCGAASCESGATFNTFYAAVVVNDPTPPGLGITGGGLSGRAGWVRGTQTLTVGASDATGIKLVRMKISGDARNFDSAKPCNYTTTTPCSPGNGNTSLAARTTELAGGPHTVTVTAYDAAGNPTVRTATVRTDNDSPAPPVPRLEGGSGWRASNAYTMHWGSPEPTSPNRAPISAVRYRVCPAGSQTGCAPIRAVYEPDPTDVSAKVPGEGEWDVRLALVDGASNGAGADAKWSAPIRLRFDPEAAQLRAGIAKTVVRRRTVTAHGRRRVVRRRVIRLVSARRVRYGRRFRVRGLLLTRRGRPRPNTPIAVYARSSQIDGQETAAGSVRTDGQGWFTYLARARSSRSLRFTYRASTATVRTLVRGRVSFRAAPRSVINGEAVTFRGRVRGPMPEGGKQVEIQAYSRGRWRTFQLFRTDQRGRYRQTYRFDGTKGKVIYPLRAVVTKEPTFPYERGVSKVRRVTVRGL